MTRVFLVDDHEIVRRGIAELLDRERDLEVVGEAGTVRDALARIPATSPDVVVLDVKLPDGDGVELCRTLLSEQSGLACLMLTAFDDDEASLASIVAGASGYVLKDIRGHRLVEGIRAVAAGRSLISKAASERIRRRLAAPATSPAQPDRAGLTLRERQVLDLITEGLTNRQIGERLGIAEKTVKNYVSELLTKLGMQRRTQAAVYGVEHRRPKDLRP